MVNVMFDPRLSERFQKTLGLSSSPATIEELIALGRKRYESGSELGNYYRSVASGDRVIGETDADRGQSIALPDGREVKVMCSYDSLMTAVLRGRGSVEAACPHCGEKMRVTVVDGSVTDTSSESIVFWLGDGPVGIPICDHFNLFPDLEHLGAWLSGNVQELGVPLALSDAVEFMRLPAEDV